MHEPLLTIQEVSTYLGIPVATLYQWRYQGTGPRVARMGRHLRYRIEDVDAWVNARSSVGSAAGSVEPVGAGR